MEKNQKYIGWDISVWFWIQLFSTYYMENGGVDRTVIECRQHQLGQMADIPPLLTFNNFWLDVPQIKYHTMQHALMN